MSAPERPLPASVLRRRVLEALHGSRPPVDPTRGAVPGLRAPVPPVLRERIAAPAQPAAVLVPLVERDTGLHLLFTERAAALRHHAGQISFPGGRIETADRDPLNAALREAEEEIGLAPDRVAVAGYLPTQLTVVSGFAITPVVGLIGGDFRPRPDPVEVAAVFEVALDALLAPGAARHLPREFHGALIDSVEFHVAGRRIWGATAAILWRLAGLLEGTGGA